jgi:hypothetical protein
MWYIFHIKALMRLFIEGLRPHDLEDANRHDCRMQNNKPRPTNMTRKGKIARMPDKIRQEINQRLLNGEEGKSIIQWMNELPEVKQILGEHFDGEPVSGSNLTEWKQGGYLEWKQQKNINESLERMFGGSRDMVQAVKAGMADQMALMLAAHIMMDLRQLPYVGNSDEKGRRWRELRVNLASLKRYEYLNAKMAWEKKHREHCEQEKEPEEDKMTPEEKEVEIRRIMGLPIDCEWDHQARKWVGPGAPARELQDKIEEEIRLKYAEEVKKLPERYQFD